MDLIYSQWISRSARTQAMAVTLLAPPPFLLAEQYASAVTTLGVALCWMPVLPISPFIAALGERGGAVGGGECERASVGCLLCRPLFTLPICAALLHNPPPAGLFLAYWADKVVALR